MGLTCQVCTTVASRAKGLTHSAAPRAYLIGLSTAQRQPLLGDYDQGIFRLNHCGQIVADEWVRSASNRKGIEVDVWTMTPDRLQSIVFLPGDGSSERELPDHLLSHKPWLLSSFIAGFKAAAAKRINLRRNQLGQPVWQRNYDELLIDDQAKLNHLRDQLRGTVS